MTELAALLAAQIAAEGPITVADYMAAALGHPEHGYYRTRDPLGRGGDFITAPEVSQMFGELVGLWCADLWQRMGRPSPVRLVELGPGRGTLMADALRAAGQAPGFRDCISVHLVETSPVLQESQERALIGAGVQTVWHTAFEEVPDGPLLLVANEFFDALPVHQLVATPEGWRERLIGHGPDGFHFVVGESPTPHAALLSPALSNAPDASIAEVCPAALELVGAIATRLGRDGGGALIIDYGPAESGIGDSLQAIRGHAAHPPLLDPGAADVTAHVDFAALARAALVAGAAVHGPAPQGAFLRKLGIEARAGMLRRKAPEAVAAALHRLIDPGQMGTLFKALALTGPGKPAPLGF